MSVKKQSPPPQPKLVKLNKEFKLAERWVNNMTGDAGEEGGELEMEGRPSRLGLGAKVPRKFKVGPLNDPIERKLHKKLEAKRSKPVGDEESVPPAENGSSGDEILDSRTNAFSRKRPAPPTITPQAMKKRRLGLGAKVPRKFKVGPLNDPIERKLHKKLEAKRSKPVGDEESVPPAENGSSGDEILDSRTNAFSRKRPAPPTITPQAMKKRRQQ